MGMSLAEYEATVGPLNRHYHEYAESVMLHKQGVLPLDPDEDPANVDSPSSKTGTRQRL